MKHLLIALLIVLIATALYPGSSTRTAYFLDTGYSEFKEAENLGLVFRGLSINQGIRWDFPKDNHCLSYSYKLGADLMTSKEMRAANVCLKPVKLAYLWQLPVQKPSLMAGPCLDVEYDLTLYPELQSGLNYWLAYGSLSLEARAALPLSFTTLNVILDKSVLGMVSRNKTHTEQYFFDLELGQTLQNVNSGFRYRDFTSFNNLNLQVEFLNYRHFTLAYYLDYNHYTPRPALETLSQGLRFSWVTGR
jgi:hypothetical protein